MKKFFTFRVLLLICALCVAGYACYDFFLKGGSGDEAPLDNLPRHERLSLKKNIMVMGIDERPSDGDPGRSDTLFVVMFDQNQKSVALLSIPRDSRVRIPGHGWDKINHAYAFGGRELSQKTVEEFLGIRIDNYVTVDFNGFKSLVDVIGGVDIDVEKDMYYYDDWDGFKIDLKKGRQRLDGATAIQYVRYRDEDGDIGRIKRQQHFLLAVYGRITSADMLLRIPGLGRQLSPIIKPVMPMGEMLAGGRALHSMVKESGLAMATVPGTPQYIDGISYWLPDIKALRQEMADMQGAQMSARYKSAADLLAREYERSVTRAMHGEDKEEGEKAIAPRSFLNAETKAISKKSSVKKDGKEKTKSREPKEKAQSKSARKDTAKTEGKPEAGSQTSAGQEETRSAPPAAADRSPAATSAVVAHDRSKTVVRVVICSGSEEAADGAAARV